MAYYSSLPGQTEQFMVEERIPQQINSYQRVNENIPTSVRPVVRDVHPGYINPVYNPMAYAPRLQPAPVVAPVVVQVPVEVPAAASNKAKKSKCCSPTTAVIITVIIAATLIGLGVGLGFYFTNKSKSTASDTSSMLDHFNGNYYGSSTGYIDCSHFSSISSHTAGNSHISGVATLSNALFSDMKRNGKDILEDLFDIIVESDNPLSFIPPINQMLDLEVLITSLSPEEVYNFACNSAWFNNNKQKSRGNGQGHGQEGNKPGSLFNACASAYSVYNYMPICF